MEELRRRCSCLEKDKCEALEKLKESIEAVKIAKMQKTQVITFFSVSLFNTSSALPIFVEFTSVGCCAASKQAASFKTAQNGCSSLIGQRDVSSIHCSSAVRWPEMVLAYLIPNVHAHHRYGLVFNRGVKKCLPPHHSLIFFFFTRGFTF